MDLNKYADLFFTEAREHLARMNNELATLEEDTSIRSGDGNRSESVNESVASIFRAVHTIKGMAAAMQYSSVVESAHELEAELDQLREGASLSPLVVARLTYGADLLARSIDVEQTSYLTRSSQEGTVQDPPVINGFRQRSSDRKRRVRVESAQLDALMDLTGELEIARGQLEQKVQGINDDSLTQMVAKVSRSINELRDQVISVQMIGVTQIFEQFPRLVRETARSLGKSIDFRIDSGDIEIDRSMLDALADPIVHLLRNAVDHGIEASEVRTDAGKPVRGQVTLSAMRDADRIVIRVTDDGGGVDRDRVLARAHSNGTIAESVSVLSDAQLMDVLASAGFSTAQHVTEVSGRGVGLDVVETSVRALGGTLSIESVRGTGTTITMRLPLSTAIVRGLLVQIGDEIFILPVANVLEIMDYVAGSTTILPKRESRTGAGSVVEASVAHLVVDLRQVLNAPIPYDEMTLAVTVDIRGRRIALIVDDVVGHREIVVKRFARPQDASPLFSGATIMRDGVPALIVDVNSLVREYSQ